MAVEAEEIASAVGLPDGVSFQTLRRRIRTALEASGVAARLDDAVARILAEE